MPTMPHPMKVIYIAGPFRGANAWEIEENVRTAERLGLAVARLGMAPMIPHSNTRYFHGALPDQFWLDATLALLSKCDALITTPDWRRSSGARAEVSYCHTHKIPVFHRIEELWAGTR